MTARGQRPLLFEAGTDRVALRISCRSRKSGRCTKSFRSGRPVLRRRRQSMRSSTPAGTTGAVGKAPVRVRPATATICDRGAASTSALAHPATGNPSGECRRLGLSDPCGMLTRMNEDVFWQLIEDCRPTGPDPDAEILAATLTERLAQSPLSVVIGFAEQLSWALYRLDRKEYGYDLSGDAFLYTRAAVVAAGRSRIRRRPPGPRGLHSLRHRPHLGRAPALHTGPSIRTHHRGGMGSRHSLLL